MCVYIPFEFISCWNFIKRKKKRKSKISDENVFLCSTKILKAALGDA